MAQSSGFDPNPFRHARRRGHCRRRGASGGGGGRGSARVPGGEMLAAAGSVRADAKTACGSLRACGARANRARARTGDRRGHRSAGGARGGGRASWRDSRVGARRPARRGRPRRRLARSKGFGNFRGRFEGATKREGRARRVDLCASGRAALSEGLRAFPTAGGRRRRAHRRRSKYLSPCSSAPFPRQPPPRRGAHRLGFSSGAAWRDGVVCGGRRDRGGARGSGGAVPR